MEFALNFNILISLRCIKSIDMVASNMMQEMKRHMFMALTSKPYSQIRSFLKVNMTNNNWLSVDSTEVPRVIYTKLKSSGGGGHVMLSTSFCRASVSMLLPASRYGGSEALD